MPARSWLVQLLVAVAVLAVPGVAAAHVGLAASEPAAGARLESAPERVRLALDDPIEDAFLTLEVTGPGGLRAAGPPRRDPADPQAILVDLPAGGGPGLYRVRWRALSEDGHPAGGALSFGVRGPGSAAGAAPSPVRSDHGAVDVVARLLALVAPIGLLGLVLLAAAVVAPALRAGGVAPPERPEAREAFRARAAAALAPSRGAWWRVFWALAAAGLVGLALTPVALLRALRAGPGDLGTLLTDTRFGLAWWVQLGGLALSALAAAAVARRGGLPEGPLAGLLAVGPALALVAISWAGHASATGSDRGVNIAIDALHNGATAAWLGGLAGLLALLPASAARLGGEDRVRLAAGVVVRFSALAVTCVTLLVVTGVYRALAELRSIGDLLDSSYGLALLVKLCLFAVLMGVGAVNRFVIHPRLERAALGLDPSDRGAARALRTSLRAELLLAGALLASVAVLISLAPTG